MLLMLSPIRIAFNGNDKRGYRKLDGLDPPFIGTYTLAALGRRTRVSVFPPVASLEFSRRPEVIELVVCDPKERVTMHIGEFRVRDGMLLDD